MNSDVNRLREIFHRMQSDGFDVNKPLRWGYYFIDKSKDNLISVYEELKVQNYQLIDLSELEDSEWRLVVAKTDILTPEKLHEINLTFNILADHYGVDTYDGWDVEKACVRTNLYLGRTW